MRRCRYHYSAMPRPVLAFTRQEVAGAFGDLGTDLPLLVGVVLATGMDPATAFVLFGTLQVLSGVVYRLPMPVQPLKAMAAIAIAGKIAPTLLAAGGVIVGITMLLLAVTGALDWMARTVPKPVVRGIQLGLGIQLATLATTRFLGADGLDGLGLAALALGIVVTLRTNRYVPAALVVLALGVGYAAWRWPANLPAPWGWHVPAFAVAWPSRGEFAEAALLLALPQIALSLGNSVLATRQVVRDLFPDRPPLEVTRIGATYGIMNLLVAPFTGLPVCHGSGGVAGHYAFGARTGGSVVVYGTALIVAGLTLTGDPAAFQRLVPGPILGTLLLVEAVAVGLLLRDLRSQPKALALAAACGMTAAWVPYGYAVALVTGTLVWRAVGRAVSGSEEPAPQP